MTSLRIGDRNQALQDEVNERLSDLEEKKSLTVITQKEVDEFLLKEYYVGKVKEKSFEEDDDLMKEFAAAVSGHDGRFRELKEYVPLHEKHRSKRVRNNLVVSFKDAGEYEDKSMAHPISLRTVSERYDVFMLEVCGVQILVNFQDIETAISNLNFFLKERDVK